MKKIIAMTIAVMLILTTAALGATALGNLGIIRDAKIENYATGEWSAMGYYNAETDSVNEIYLDVLILEFEGSDVYAGIYTENGGVRYQETVTFNEGYLTFAPDGVYATETFVVFPMENNMLGAYQSAEGKMFAENAPVDFYILQPRAIVDAARSAEIANETPEAAGAGIYEAVVYLMGDYAAEMTAEEAAELEGYAAELETVLAELFGVTVEDVKTVACNILIGIEGMSEEAKAELEAAVAELGELIAEIPEEELIAAGEFIEEVLTAFAEMTEEEMAELEAMANELEAAVAELGELIAEIPEEELIAAGEFIEEVLTAFAEMTEEEMAELEAMVNELGEAIAQIPAQDLEAFAAFLMDALEYMTAPEMTVSIMGMDEQIGFLFGLMV